MHRSSAKRLSAFIVSVSLVSFLTLAGGLSAATQPPAGKKVAKPTVIHAQRVGISPPMRTMKTVKPTTNTNPKNLRQIPNPRLPRRGGPNAPIGQTQNVQRTMGHTPIPEPITSFDGVSDVDLVQPADTTMDVSPDQILQWVNLSWSVYDKSGNQLGGPFEGTSFWSDLGGVCANNNGGDILVRWDQIAKQWWVSQLAYPGGVDGFHQCIAVSTSSDALGTYYQYDFLYSATDLNDYPKVGMWPVSGGAAGASVVNDGFYVSVNNFANGGSGPFTSSKIMAFDRQAQLSGNPGVMQIFDVGDINPNFGILLPADLRGTTLPANGSLETYINMGRPDLDGSSGPVLHILQSFTDFTNPDNSFLVQLDDIPVDDFDWFTLAFDGAPQVGGGTLEVLNDRPMYRADYRVFSDHDSLLMMHDVNVGSVATPQSGERWYEVRGAAAGSPTLFQSGTYGPDDSTWRWMGSIAQDAIGDISMGFSATSDGSGIVPDPSVHYTGRLVGDSPGTMTQSEDTYIDSSEPFFGFRWGDYSTVVVDPVDQCTFWYTTMYGAGDWATRIGSFKFPSCTTGATGTISGTVTNGANPIAGAMVTAGASFTFTDAGGGYSFTLPVGTYSMTASKFGFLPGSASGIEVTDGGTTNQNFVLAAAPTVAINGVVKDASGGGWPLYARVVITASGAPTFTLYTDPVTGYYAQTLVSGIPYTFTVTAVSGGYLPGGGTVPLIVSGFAPNAVVVNWDLLADLQTCQAPGYSFPPGTLFETFNTGSLPAGWSVENNGTGALWTITSGGDPCGQFPGNQTGGTGAYALANSNCSSPDTDTSLVSPSLDFSSIPSPVLRFAEDYNANADNADVDVSTNGGASWTNVLNQTSSERGPQTVELDLSALAGGHADVRARFHYYGNDLWAWWWQVDNVLLGNDVCTPHPGGLVVGNVTSVNTGAGLNGATVANTTSAGSVETFATPDDPAQPDGMYILFSESGQQALQASLSLYGTDHHTVTVIPNSAVRQNFSLVSGSVTAAPSPINSRVNPAGTDSKILTLSNSGGNPASFQIIAVDAPLLTDHTVGFASQALRRQALERLGSGRQNPSHSAKGLAPLPNAPAPGHTLGGGAGEVLASYMLDLNGPWGLSYDLKTDNPWASDFEYFGGTNSSYQYTAAGVSTGATISETSFAGPFDLLADGTFNVQTGMLWQVVAGSDQCVHELNPTTKTVTGNKICPNWGLPGGERGLAYDASTQTYYSGSWEDGVINHFDSSGTILDSAFVGLNISGLAYFSSSGHLFVMVNNVDEPVTVLDAKNNYAVLGSFEVTQNGTPVFGNFAGAAMEADCDGNLWLVNQTDGRVYKVASGEFGSPCTLLEIPWLTENPKEGTIAAAARPLGASNSQPITLSFDSGTLLPGLRQAQLKIITDTPVAVPAVPVTLTVRFLDVPDDNQFQAFIYGAAGAGVMMGGTPVCTDVLHFCPNGIVTRADMAGYLFRASHGVNTPPPVYQNTFADVSFNDYNAFYIQGIFDDGITGGCSANPRLYCPSFPVTRAQMAVFVWKDQHGSEPPPACTPPGVFLDVPCPDAFAVDYIEGIYHEGITAGCGGGNFCPHGPITNGQMAVFMVKAFNIPYLP
jgi:Carboxypeptidase regulatory-like domain/S-layer homology domain